MIVKANKIKDKFFDFVRKEFEKETEYYYAYEQILEDETCVNNYLCVLEQDTIIDIIYTSTIYGIYCLNPFFIKSKNYISNLKELYSDKDVIFLLDEDEIPKDFFKCNIHSSVDLEHTYSEFRKYYVLNSAKINILRDAIEKEWFPTMDEVTVKVVDSNDLFSYISNNYEDINCIWKNRVGCTNVIGFHYLDLNDNSGTFLFLETNNKPIACIKFGKFGDYFTNDVHYGLCFIDVSKPYRNRGLAKKIIRELKNVLPTDYPFVLSFESEMGQICQMHKHFKEIFPTCYTDTEWMKHLY